MLIRMALFLSLLNAIFFNICHASLNKTPGESEIIQSILAESQKEKNWRDSSALNLIKDFAYQKLKDYAKKNEAFAKELVFGTDEDKNVPEKAVDIIRLENGYLLLTVSTIDIGPKKTQLSYDAEPEQKQNGLYFFLIQNGQSDWIPLQFDLTKKEKGGRAWFLLCYEVEYELPFLKIYTNNDVGAEGYSDIDVFLFKDGSFNLVRTIRTFRERLGPDIYYLDYIKEEVILYE